MSATATSQSVHRPVSRLGGWTAGAIGLLALAAIIGAAAASFVGDTGPAVPYDPTAAQRIHLVREYGGAPSYGAWGALQMHVLRENQPD